MADGGKAHLTATSIGGIEGQTKVHQDPESPEVIEKAKFAMAQYNERVNSGEEQGSVLEFGAVNSCFTQVKSGVHYTMEVTYLADGEDADYKVVVYHDEFAQNHVIEFEVDDW